MATAFLSDLKSNTRKEMIDLVNARMRDHIDVIAERCVIPGGVADGTSQTVAEKSTLTAYPTGEDTADLLPSVSRAVDKDAWFIGAHNE